MSEKNVFPIEFEPDESTEIIVPKNIEEAIAEVDIEDSLYGKNKPRRIEIRREIVHD